MIKNIENVNRLLSCSARRILFTEEKARIFQFDKFGCMENTGLFLQPFFQHFRIGCVGQRSFLCNDALFTEVHQTHIHGDHIIFGRGGNEAVDLVDFVVADHIADGRCDAHNFEGRYHSSVYRRHKLL